MALKVLRSGDPVEEHGGSIAGARRLFPAAPEPWIDLSTGISPHSYPLFALDSTALSRLPEPERIRMLRQAAAETYCAPQSVNVVASPGTQPLLPLIAGLVRPGKARVLGPTYSEHARCAALAGHDTAETADFGELGSADLAIVVNPDNPTGRLLARDDLLSLAGTITQRDGLLVVDEAFMDVTPPGYSLAGDVEGANVIVLRSFGKFFGLAGIRLSFAIAAQPLAGYLAAALGPWPISAPALEYGLAGLTDHEWQSAMRERLARETAELRRILRSFGLILAGGTSLFQFVQHPDTTGLCRYLGQAGMAVRLFSGRPQHFRIGLPGSAEEWERLGDALDAWRGSQRA